MSLGSISVFWALGKTMSAPKLDVGDWVIYRKQKVSASPGPRAQQTAPAAKGETYNYVVKKYWVVQDVLSESQVRLRTRRGKTHDVDLDDPRLRKARWWERWLLSDRFLRVESAEPDIMASDHEGD